MDVSELLSNIPKAVRIGPHSISIVVKELEGAWGTHSEEEQTIFIDPRMPSKSVLVDTLLHEICHGIWSGFGLPKRADEERVVTVFGTGLAALLKDNPKLITWLKKGLK